jgi:hypothetical protein
LCKGGDFGGCEAGCVKSGFNAFAMNALSLLNRIEFNV